MDPFTRTGHATSSEPTVSSAGMVESAAAAPNTTWSQHWSSFIQTYAHAPVLYGTRRLARSSALHPKRTIVSIVLLSFALVTIGLFTNFSVDVDTDEMWTPIQSDPVKHARYISETFAAPPRYFILFFHSYGDTILTVDKFRNMFQAVDTVRAHPDYAENCLEFGDALDRYGERTCDIYGVTKFWWNNVTEFERAVAKDSPEIIHTTTAKRAFLDNVPVLHEEIFGFLKSNFTYVESAQSTSIVIYLPDTDRIRAAEPEMVQSVLDLNEQWGDDDNFRVEVLAYDSIPNELIRGVNKDIPLIPIVFVAMSLFTSFVFSRRHKVYSRGILGAGAVVAIMLSLASGFGLLFIIGTPFSTFHYLLMMIRKDLDSHMVYCVKLPLRSSCPFSFCKLLGAYVESRIY